MKTESELSVFSCRSSIRIHLSKFHALSRASTYALIAQTERATPSFQTVPMLFPASPIVDHLLWCVSPVACVRERSLHVRSCEWCVLTHIRDILPLERLHGLVEPLPDQPPV